MSAFVRLTGQGSGDYNCLQPMCGLRMRCALFFLFLAFLVSPASGQETGDWRVLLDRMEKAYAAVADYRTNTEVRSFGSDGSFETERFLYTFRKPKSIRLDFESPHPGMVIVYPDKNGKAVIRPPGIARFVVFHLAPDNPMLKTSSGQPIDKTDMGLLIEHISQSLRGAPADTVEVRNQGGQALIRVLARNHFRKGIPTLYEFSVDACLGLPVGVKEMTPEGKVERTITLRNLQINTGTPEDLFWLDGEKGSERKEKGEE